MVADAAISHQSLEFAAATQVPLEGFAGLPASQAVMDDVQRNLKANDGDSCSRDCALIIVPLVGVLNGVGQEKVVHAPLGQVRPDRGQVGDAELGMEGIVGVGRPDRTETVEVDHRHRLTLIR